MSKSHIKIKCAPSDLHIGQRVKRLRIARGVAQEKLGEHLGLTFQQIQKYENGVNRIGSGTLYEIAKVLEVAPEYFFEGLDQNKPKPFAMPSPDAMEIASRIDDLNEIRRHLTISCFRNIIAVMAKP